MTHADPIPTAVEVTAGWLTERLRDAGFLDAEVSDLECRTIGLPHVSGCFRFTLQYARPDPAYPATIIGKFPSDDATTREFSAQIYANEVAFYRDLQARVTIPTPVCFLADIDGAGPAFVLLLEDMHPARQGNQVAGCGPDLAHAAVVQLVELHAPTWCDASLLRSGWLAQDDPAGFQTLLQQLYRDFLAEPLERFDADLSAEAKELMTRVGEGAEFPVGVLDPDPFCVVHGDYRLDNLLIDESLEPPRITAVDWQTMGVTSPLTDVAYFMGASLHPADRRETEESIVRAYHEALAAAGIEDFDWAACWEGYRRASLYGLGIAVLARGVAARNPDGDGLFRVLLQRHAAHALDLGAEEFLF
ncbi:MAG: phosphotransferase [bacterium]|nr:phosphotransferase [bacterium]